uniref:Uncharacterized protein n=1 Tax=Oryza sativa subsp. japonica TaxID=39947 RepID=Q6H8B6_ORYSJ|nr:uncharacterized protein LOC107280040 [Oryza sativa Japonica Group]BAD25033.1 hypothetical protein [Oryza sativa Japonica Group]
MASPAIITILAVSLLLLLPPLALGSITGGDQRRKEPWITTILNGGGSIAGMELQQRRRGGHGLPVMVRSAARRSLGGRSTPNNPGDGGRNPPVSPARDRPGTEA